MDTKPFVKARQEFTAKPGDKEQEGITAHIFTGLLNKCQ
jgi:hypothetical protein